MEKKSVKKPVKAPVKSVTSEKSQATNKPVKGVADHVDKVSPRPKTSIDIDVNVNMRRVGIAKGATIQVDGYQFARLDFWMERIVPDDDKSAQVAYNEMSAMIDAQMEEEVDKLSQE